MSATDELRKMLDERGVEWGTNETLTDCWTRWNVGNLRCTATEINGRFAFTVGNCTPKQAIAATLGSGTCHDVNEDEHDFTCSECGASMYTQIDDCWTMIGAGGMTKDVIEHPNYCPNCGAKVIEEEK